MNILYSVIVPHYNDAERLERLLKSIPLHRNDIEVIVVDDCSPEQDSLDLVRSKWSKVVWESTPENSGAGVARNVGLDNAQGRWLIFGDSDDEFIIDAFKFFDDVLKENDQLVYFLAEAVQEKDGSSSIRADSMNDLVSDFMQLNSDKSLHRLKLQHVNPVAKVYSRDFIDSLNLRFDPVRRSNDIAFNVLAAVQASHIRAERISVYRIYRRTQSLTADVSATAFLERFFVSHSLAKRLEMLGICNSISATGNMLLAIRYGPNVMRKVWWKSIFSPMYIEWARLFDFMRWKNFFLKQFKTKKERIKN